MSSNDRNTRRRRYSACWIGWIMHINLPAYALRCIDPAQNLFIGL